MSGTQVGGLKPWIMAFRLRTLPLALSSIAMGSFVAAFHGSFNLEIFVFAALTTVLLQILSNLANDYGDFVNGADGAERKGPDRAVQSGAISPGTMKLAIGVFSLLSLFSGLYLLSISIGLSSQIFFWFLGLGLAAILAAITYTAGSKPYGYAGFGDISVLIFFGFVGVVGTYFLHNPDLFNMNIALPAIACGLFSVAVLNVNNIRDIESDYKAGKKSIPVRIGRENAILYHLFLLMGGWIAALIFTITNFKAASQLLFLFSLPLFIKNYLAIQRNRDASQLDPYLKQMALSTFIFVILFGIGLVLS